MPAPLAEETGSCALQVSWSSFLGLAGAALEVSCRWLERLLFEMKGPVECKGLARRAKKSLTKLDLFITNYKADIIGLDEKGFGGPGPDFRPAKRGRVVKKSG